MGDKINKFFNDKRIAFAYVLVIVVLLSGVTYALTYDTVGLNIATAVIGIDEDNYGNTSFDSGDIVFMPVLDSDVNNYINNGEGEEILENIIKIDFKVRGASGNTLDENIIYDIALVDFMLDCDLLNENMKWKLIKNGEDITPSGASFSYKFDTIKNGRYVLTNTQQDLIKYNGTGGINGFDEYSFYMWLSDSCQSESIASCSASMDQTNMIGNVFSGKIEVELYTGQKKDLVRDSDPNRISPVSGSCINNYSKANKPNLDSGLIPVYYDETAIDSDGSVGAWKKANANNNDNSWYNYGEKKWANAVLISNDTKREEYQSASVDTLVPISDISAFFVWIPRFKYRVWNISRQPATIGSEASYAYPAYSKGIDISFELGVKSTGNVECTYDVSNVESDTNLSDSCVYNSFELINTTSDNTKYQNAWYTHPAFTFGEEEKTGFWIGKFETTGMGDVPTILPDLTSLRNQTVSEQFTTSKKFQNYGLTNNIDAHMLTNLEWGAVAYLTHSIYGVCDDNSCRGVFQNNSSDFITGRSSGALAPNSTSSAYGTYSYKGYSVNSSGNLSSTKNETLVASTTGNIYGVYDMSGGSAEYVMGYMVDSNGNFNSLNSGNNWNGSTNLDSRYYNSYSYGKEKYYVEAFNRARLGDATAEIVTLNTSNYYNQSWSPSYNMYNAYSSFVYEKNNINIWFERGGTFGYKTAGLFHFNALDGSASPSAFDDTNSSGFYHFSFRVSIS